MAVGGVCQPCLACGGGRRDPLAVEANGPPGAWPRRRPTHSPLDPNGAAPPRPPVAYPCPRWRLVRPPGAWPRQRLARLLLYPDCATTSIFLLASIQIQRLMRASDHLGVRAGPGYCGLARHEIGMQARAWAVIARSSHCLSDRSLGPVGTTGSRPPRGRQDHKATPDFYHMPWPNAQT
jgi:hypothetical protein